MNKQTTPIKNYLQKLVGMTQEKHSSHKVNTKGGALKNTERIREIYNNYEQIKTERLLELKQKLD